jgi:hypothetical protein
VPEQAASGLGSGGTDPHSLESLIGGDAQDLFGRVPAMHVQARVLADELRSGADVAEACYPGDPDFLQAIILPVLPGTGWNGSQGHGGAGVEKGTAMHGRSPLDRGTLPKRSTVRAFPV